MIEKPKRKVERNLDHKLNPENTFYERAESSTGGLENKRTNKLDFTCLLLYGSNTST